MSEVFDPRALRDAFGAFATGVTVVTARGADGRPIGFTANSFTSVSLDPPLLLVCLAKTSRNLRAMSEAKGFAVNILAEDQQDVSNVFARPVEDRFAHVEWIEGPSGSPVFPLAAAWFDCRRETIVDAGDHVILLGRVEGFANSERNGLGYVRGAYFKPSLGALALSAAASEDETLVAAVVEREGQILLVEGEDGRFQLPAIVLADHDPAEALEAELWESTALRAHLGFLFSVYRDRASGRQNIVYRASVEGGEPKIGRFHPLREVPFDRLRTPQTADMLRRFAAESEIGAYGVYVGNETAGRVHAIGGKA